MTIILIIIAAVSFEKTLMLLFLSGLTARFKIAKTLPRETEVMMPFIKKVTAKRRRMSTGNKVPDLIFSTESLSLTNSNYTAQDVVLTIYNINFQLTWDRYLVH